MKAYLTAGGAAAVMVGAAMFVIAAPATTPTTAAAATVAAAGCGPSDPVGRNATVVITAGAGLPQRAAVVALAVTIVESGTLNLASAKVPESIRYPNDGVAPGDHLSINLFQQQVGMGWFDTVAHGMDPAYAAASFYRHLTAVPGWETMPLGQAAQTVQRSAFPARYGAVETQATALYAKWSNPPPCPVVPAAMVTGSWANPLKPAPYLIWGGWGPRKLTDLLGRNFHYGQDLGVPVGTPVRAVCGGLVIGAGPVTGGGGLQVRIDCGGGVQVKLMHNSVIRTTVGATVPAGAVVASSGDTGFSTDPHVHVQVEVGGVPVDPVPFLKAKGIVL